MKRFRRLVSEYIDNHFHEQSALIHSHERSNCHHVTTFHGPPISDKRSFLHNLFTTRRVAAWKQMEKDELLSNSTVQILAVSSSVKDQLLNLYPEVTRKQINIAHPGIHPRSKAGFKPIGKLRPPDKFLFVGKEWKRKGLDLAIKILEQLPKHSKLDVYGPSRDDLPHRLAAHPRINIMGWKEEIPWWDYAVLIHPAKKEPFGMVVAEARFHGVKVLTSSEVGSVELGFRDLVSLEPSAPIVEWVKALENLTTDCNNRLTECLWTWSDLADLHKNTYYPAAYRALMNDG